VLGGITMSSLDKTMHFDFNENKGKNIYDTLQDVYNALELLATYCLVIQLIFHGTMMRVI
jgi:uncharacterized protein (UPF0297 family)